MKKLLQNLGNKIKSGLERIGGSSSTISRRTFVAFDNDSVDKVISLTAKELKEYSENAVEDSTSITNYFVRTEGQADIVDAGAAQMQRYQDATIKRAENEHEKATSDLATHLEEIPEKKRRVKESYARIFKYIIDRRHIKLAPVLKKLKKATARLNEIEDDLYKLSEQLPKGIHTEKGFVSSRTLLIIGIIVLLGAELFATFNAFQILQAPPIAEIPIVIGVTISLFVLGKMIVWTGKKAELIVDTPEKQENVYDYAFGFLLFVSLAFCVFLGHLRIEYLEICGSEVSTMTRIFLYLLSPVLFIASTALTALLANASGDVRKLYTSLLKKRTKQQKKVDRYQRKKDRIKRVHLTEYEREQQNLLSDLENIEVDQTEELEEVVLQTSITLNDVRSIANRYEDQFYATMGAIIEKSRADIEVKTGEKYTWKPLKFKKQNTDYERPFLPEKSKQQTQNNNNMNTKKKLNGILHPALFIIGLFMLGSCSESSFEGTDHTIIHLVDRTSLKDSDYHVTADNIWELAEMNKSDFNGFDYQTGNITDVSLSKSHQIGIEPANELMSNSLNRDKQIKCIKSGLDSLLNLAYQGEDREYKHTELFAPLTRAFDKIHSLPVNESATIILQSDLVHNHGVSLYVKDINSRGDYEDDLLLEKLNGIIPSGFSQNREVMVIVLHSPTVNDDRDFRYCYGLLNARLEKYPNIQLTQKANL